MNVHELTKINFYFLDIVSHMVEMEKTIKENKDDLETLRCFKNMALAINYKAALWDEKADQVRDLRKAKISFQFIRWLTPVQLNLNPNTLFLFNL